jgi:hypothetical protein
MKVSDLFSKPCPNAIRNTIFAATIALGLAGSAESAQHGHLHGTEAPKKHSERMPSRSTLRPAEGASVKIISPRAEQAFEGDAVPLEFEVKKGRIGEHVHAYVNGELAGMFKTTKGTLNGLKPGRHTLELRVATGDHKTELNATDRVTFTTK